MVIAKKSWLLAIIAASSLGDVVIQPLDQDAADDPDAAEETGGRLRTAVDVWTAWHWRRLGSCAALHFGD